MKDKKELITDIIQVLAAGGCYISGELFFKLIFLTESELIKIAQELYIKTTK